MIKHNALSLDRSTDSSNKKAFPTSVYLDKLEGSGQHQAERPRTSSTHSDDIFDDISPAASNVSNVSPENITEQPKKVYNKGGGQHRKHRKHHRHHHYHTAAAAAAKAGEEGGGTPLPTSSRQVGEGERGVYSSSNHGSFRFLNAEEISDNTSVNNRKQAKFSAKERQKAKEHQKIQWSDNEDRLI